jgi:hypothetical protein
VGSSASDHGQPKLASSKLIFCPHHLRLIEFCKLLLLREPSRVVGKGVLPLPLRADEVSQQHDSWGRPLGTGRIAYTGAIGLLER